MEEALDRMDKIRSTYMHAGHYVKQGSPLAGLTAANNIYSN